MYQWLNNWLVAHGAAGLRPWLTLVLMALITAAICLAVRFVLGWLLLRLVRGITKLKRQHWADIALKNNLPQRVAGLSIPIVISIVASSVPESLNFLQKAAAVAGGIVFLLLVHSLARTANDIYQRHAIAKTRPLTGLLQVVQVVAVILTCIVVIAILLGQRPAVLIGGIGATAAVVSFVFKDPILGFIAGVQLTTGDLLRIGDWITVPGASADGTVTEISMTTVTVQNFDNSTTSVPAYSLVTGSFVNWRSMSRAGARRIKRSVYIDAGGVRLCDEAMLARFEGITLLESYFAQKREQNAFTVARGEEGGEPLNTSHLTNLGTFRAYMQAYLDAHGGLRHDLPVLAHQLDAGPTGIPLEVYAFTDTADWAAFEAIQADIFDHFYSAAPRFGLSLYQSPSGADLRAKPQ